MSDDFDVPPAPEAAPVEPAEAPKPAKPGRPAKAKPVAMEGAVPQNAERTRVRFLESAGPGGSDRVRAVVDGVLYAYARNEDVDVPNFVLEALEHAAPVEMDPATGNMRRVPSFPYQLVR